MGFVDTIISWVTNWPFYAIILLATVFAYGLVRKVTRRIPIINRKRTLIIACILGIILTSGILGTFGFGALTDSGGAGWSISELQVTTAFTNASSADDISENSQVDDMIDARFVDAEVHEAAGAYEVNGTILVTRTGKLPADSCNVRCVIPPKFEDESAPTGTTYPILEETSKGEYECYLATSSSTVGATTSSPKEKASLAFAEGVSTGYVGIMLEVEETGHDALDQYSYKDVIVNVCGKPFVIRIHRMDAS